VRVLGIDIGGSSVKVCLVDGDARRTARSGSYFCPARSELVAAIRSSVEQLGVPGTGCPVGLCLPGKRNETGDAIEVSVNLPCLDGWRFEELLAESLGSTPARFRVVSDVHAAAHDHFRARKPRGRAAYIAIGTGVGLCVLDDGVPVGIGKQGIGHLGLVDVGRLGEGDIFSDGGASNTLESYVGVRALRARFGSEPDDVLGERLANLSIVDPFMRALVRGLRIVHAIYTPESIVLMGGVGIALRDRGDELRAAVGEGLTSLARPGWELGFGDSLYHAASGAALLGGIEPGGCRAGRHRRTGRHRS